MFIRNQHLGKTLARPSQREDGRAQDLSVKERRWKVKERQWKVKEWQWKVKERQWKGSVAPSGRPMAEPLQQRKQRHQSLAEWQWECKQRQ